MRKSNLKHMNWKVLYLRPRSEKKLAEYCNVYGVWHYLPLRKEIKIYQRRKVMVEKPVFPGYFFASINDDKKVKLLRSNHVLKIIDPENQKQLIHDLVQVKKALDVDPKLETCNALKRGSRVKILHGPFLGIEGVVAKISKSTKIWLNVDMIGQAVTVEVDRDYLEKAD